MRKDDATFHGCPIPFPTTKWRCKVKRAVDGDTVVLLVDRGNFDDSTWELRAKSYNAPERYSGSVEEKEQGRIWWEVLKKEITGRWALLTTFMDREKYGRILGDLAVYDESGGVLVDIRVILRNAGLRIEIEERAKQGATDA